jgi:hypothetical protein
MTDVEHISRKGTGVPISWFPVPEEYELPDDLQGLFRKAREMVGFVPNVFRAYSYRPERLSAGSPTTASSTSRPRTWTRQRGR